MENQELIEKAVEKIAEYIDFIDIDESINERLSFVGGMEFIVKDVLKYDTDKSPKIISAYARLNKRVLKK